LPSAPTGTRCEHGRVRSPQACGTDTLATTKRAISGLCRQTRSTRLDPGLFTPRLRPPQPGCLAQAKAALSSGLLVAHDGRRQPRRRLSEGRQRPATGGEPKPWPAGGVRTAGGQGRRLGYFLASLAAARLTAASLTLPVFSLISPRVALGGNSGIGFVRFLLSVNRHHELTPPHSVISMVYRADRR
jgi:hypothetical protein